MNQDQIIEMAANGNAQAKAFAVSWVEFCHMMDTLNDKDAVISDDFMAEKTIAFITELCGNTFFIQHRSMLYSLMIVSIRAWVDSNKRTGVERRVLAGLYHELIWFVAFLTGGEKHMKHCTSEAREYKIEVKEVL